MSEVPGSGQRMSDPRGGTAEVDWRRLHPISPFLRGGVMVLAVGGYFISQRFESLIGIRYGPEAPEDPTFGNFWLALIAFLTLVALVVLYGWLAWRVSRFRVGDRTLEYRWGLLFKQHRQVRYDRIQSVDISRPLLARLFGLAQVVVQSAGGSDSHVELAYLTLPRALEVRDSVLSLVDAEERGHGVADPVDPPGPASLQTHPTPLGAAAGEASGAYPTSRLQGELRGRVASTRGRQVLRTMSVPLNRVVLSLLYHPTTVFVVVAVPATLAGAIFGSVGVLPVLFAIFVGAVVPQVRRFLTDANFSVDIETDRLRITHGLTDQRSNTVPLARIQAVEISQGVFWRWPDWWRMKVTIAGVVGENTESQTTAFPVGTEDDVVDLAAVMLPGLDRSALLAGMRGTGNEPGFTTSSRRSRVFQPFSWRRNGYAVTDTALVLRRGWLARVVSLVPHARVQSMRIEQGPLDRARGIASVHTDLTAGPVSGAVPHLDVPEAHRLLAEQSSRSASARTKLPGPLRLDPRPAGHDTRVEATTEGSVQL
ncbi:PH domain-containing protein [Nostocoides sp. F2B08]|uniref:PH domain-containing protein n=1 Tax=Nostocoides sp. F2B08 TaxID=2653936 RepID=UPI001262C3BC|nr:PH domain-containing protein [Tetrasphaera sp. F2B08]KAB7744688.1 PH domain-containing protein [Tetrasphaera sp. F2B08]